MLDRLEVPAPARSARTGLSLLPAGLTEVLQDVAERAMVLLPEADSVVVAVRRPSGPVELVSTGADARGVDALQRGLREGPVLDAVGSGRSVSTGDLTVERRWPRLASCAGGLDVRSASSVPVGVDGTVLGTVTAYARRPGAFGTDEVDGVGPLTWLAGRFGNDIRTALELDGARAVVVPGQLV